MFFSADPGESGGQFKNVKHCRIGVYIAIRAIASALILAKKWKS